jgi:hypothetical protein
MSGIDRPPFNLNELDEIEKANRGPDERVHGGCWRDRRGRHPRSCNLVLGDLTLR